MENLELVADNKFISANDTQNPLLVGKKFKVGISELNLERELRKFFKWRKNVTLKRFKALGSYDHDRFIIYLFKLNY